MTNFVEECGGEAAAVGGVGLGRVRCGHHLSLQRLQRRLQGGLVGQRAALQERLRGGGVQLQKKRVDVRSHRDGQVIDVSHHLGYSYTDRCCGYWH